MPTTDEQPSYRILKKQCAAEVAVKEQLSQNKIWRSDRVNLSRVNKKIADLHWSCFQKAKQEEKYFNAAQDFLSAFELYHTKAIDFYYKKNKTKANEKANAFEKTDDPGQLLRQGLCYALGLGRNQDREKAVELYEQAALSRHPTAMYFMSYAYHYGQGVKTNRKEYIKWLTWAAEAGFAQAQNELGECYRDGSKGIDENAEEAVRWFRLAAEQNYRKGALNLGTAYAEGEGIDKSTDLAEYWWGLAAEQGHPDAQYKLGNKYWYESNSKQQRTLALKWLRLSAEQGNPEAQNMLGDAYWFGKGINEDKNEAVKWFLKACYQDNAEAQYSLGFAYLHGQGTSMDLDLAKHWLKKSAKNANLSGQYLYGVRLRLGTFGKDKNQLQEGKKWLKSAAEAGHLKAQKEFENVYKEEPDKYIPWLVLAAKQKDKESLDKLKKLDRPLAKYSVSWITDNTRALYESLFMLPENDDIRKTFTTTDLPKTLKSRHGKVFIAQFIALIKVKEPNHNQFLMEIYEVIHRSIIDKKNSDEDNPEYYRQLLNNILKALDFAILDDEHIRPTLDYLLDAWWAAPNDFSNIEQFQLLWYRAQYIKSSCLEHSGRLRQLASLLISHHYKNTYTLNFGTELQPYQVEMLFSLLKCPNLPNPELINKLLGTDLIIEPRSINPNAFFNPQSEKEDMLNLKKASGQLKS